MWPAFWTLGADIGNGAANCRKCGETDILESIGKEPSSNHESLHLPATGTANDDLVTGMYTLPGGAKLGDGRGPRVSRAQPPASGRATARHY